MKLFHWANAEALQLYSSGDIVVMASSLDEAKEIVRQSAKNAFLGYTDMSNLDPDDQDDAEKFSEMMEILRADLSKDPTVHEVAAAIFINGGE